MKSNEEYLQAYHLQVKSLEEKGELWRLRVSDIESISKVEEIRRYGIDARKSSQLNDHHIQRNEEAQVSIMIMNILTFEEAK